MIKPGNAVLIAKYFVIPGNVEMVLSALREMSEAVKNFEPGCVFYNANIDPENENLICLYEVYDTEQSLLAHRDTPHFAQFIEGIIVPLLEKREREVYRLAVS